MCVVKEPIRTDGSFRHYARNSQKYNLKTLIYFDVWIKRTSTPVLVLCLVARESMFPNNIW